MNESGKQVVARETLDAKLEKDSARVSREWESLGSVSGHDIKAIALAERQGKRVVDILSQHGYRIA
jgi:hypothetical protein